MLFIYFQKKTVVAAFLSFVFFAGIHAISSVNHLHRAPRDGSPDLSISSECTGGTDSAELDLIRRCLCRLLSELQEKICNVTTISNDDAVGDTITLDTPGHYCATENLTKKIIIASSDVSLDLNLYKVSRSNANDDIITINSDLENITIKNGSVINSAVSSGTGCGILVKSGSSSVSIEQINIFSCDIGVKLDGQNGSEIIECELVALDLVSNTTGLVLNHADENTIKDCRALQNTQAGFELLNSEANCFFDCQALKTFGPQTTMGFTSRAGQSNLFQRCVSKKTKTSAWEFCNKAYGFLLTSTEEKTKLIECVVSETGVTSTVSALTYGVHLDPTLLDIDDLLKEVDDDGSQIGEVSSVAWSPTGDYIACIDSGDPSGDSYVKVFRFDGTTLIDTDTFAIDNALFSVAWSPDSKYIASGFLNLRIFDFDGSTLIPIDAEPTASLNSIEWSPDGKYIATGDDADYVRVFGFNGSTLTQIDSDNTPAADVRSVAWSPDGKYIVSGDADRRVRVFSFEGSKLTQVDDLLVLASVSSVAWSPNGKYIVSGDDGNFV